MNAEACHETGRQVFGLIGHPLGHSFSAAYFKRKFEEGGMEAFSYLNFDMEDLSSGIPLLKSDNRYAGFNVTIPYKQRIKEFLDSLSPEASAIGAVNTVKVERDGTWTGHNTDCVGFYESLRRFLPEGARFPALVLGNGGASQAVQYALHRHGWRYFLVCRHPQESGKAFAPAKTFTYAGLPAHVVSGCRLIVNTTSLGMFPDVESCPVIPYEAVGADHFAFDLVYNPVETAFMKRCSERGAKTCNGLEMLYLQAEAAWKVWTGPSVG